ncbi:Ribonuclease [Melia azedarach]|uniref:Ribonuclease n=1 Tax=Melia azedarach TaxID=155640 RepID=A0ACC1XJM5_MELAZ|nr:Ribonuclease [Melia azedarach]
MISNSKHSIFIKVLMIQCPIPIGLDRIVTQIELAATQQQEKPATNFSIHGLWPNYNNASWPENSDPQNPYKESQITNLNPRMQVSWPTLSCPSANGSKFWKHERDKHGTCSESVLDQHDYFERARPQRQRRSSANP